MDNANFYRKKKVQLWPGDTHSKEGEILFVDDAGFLIKITMSNDERYREGKTYFISHSAKLIFKFLED